MTVLGSGACPAGALRPEYPEDPEYVWLELPPPDFPFLHETIPNILIIAPSANTIMIFDKLLVIFFLV
jgi:hypothetical protein